MIYSRKKDHLKRRGVSAVEAAVVYPITMLLLLGTVVLGLGVFRYQQIQSLAMREGSRGLRLGARPAICRRYGQRVRDELECVDLHRNAGGRPG